MNKNLKHDYREVHYSTESAWKILIRVKLSSRMGTVAHSVSGEIRLRLANLS